MSAVDFLKIWNMDSRYSMNSYRKVNRRQPLQLVSVPAGKALSLSQPPRSGVKEKFWFRWINNQLSGGVYTGPGFKFGAYGNIRRIASPPCFRESSYQQELQSVLALVLNAAPVKQKCSNALAEINVADYHLYLQSGLEMADDVFQPSPELCPNIRAA